MSGMAGNASAFSTVWTYDLYGAFINRHATDKHYVSMGRASTLLGVFVSIGTAYLVQHSASIMDYAVQLMSFFIAPLFATVLLGMMWKRATNAGGFWGLLVGICTSVGLWAWVRHTPAALKYVALSSDAKDMAENMYRALWSWIVAMIVTVAVSYCTKPRPASELAGLVYGATELPSDTDAYWYERPGFWAITVGLVFIAINIVFW